MKLKPSVVAVLLAFSATAAWAADSDNAVQYIDDSNPTQAVGNAPSSSVENTADDATGWQYINGQQAASDAAGSSDQAASEQGSGETDQTAATGDSSRSDQTAASDKDSSGTDQSASADSGTADQSAMSEDSADSDQTAAGENSGDADQAANAEESGDDQTAMSEESGDDQTAMSEDPVDSDQSAASEEQGGNDQLAQDSDDADLMAMANQQTRAGTFKPATLEDFKAATQDKLVVILPSGWQGSVPQLIATLQEQSDASEILILSQDNPDEDSDQ
jgi:hypothetical protein